MRKIYINLFILFLISSFYQSVFAQQNEFEIRLRNRTFTPDEINVSSKAIELTDSKNLLVQFNQSVTKEIVNELYTLGIKVNGLVSKNTLSINAEAFSDVELIDNVRWVGALQAEDKISPSNLNENGIAHYVVVLHEVEQKREILFELENVGAEIIDNQYLNKTDVLIKLDASRILSVADLDAVSFIYNAPNNVVKGKPIYRCSGAATAYGHAPEFVTNGLGWDGPGLGPASLKYRFINGTPDIQGENAEVLAALDTWSDYANISFNSTSLIGQDKSIDILWGSFAHGDGFPFDGPSNVLAHCFYPDDINPEPIAGDMHFDESELWRIGTGIDIYTIALHEMGHGLGLAHSADSNAVMFAFYGEPVADLHADDIQGIRTLYSTKVTPRSSQPVFNPVSGTYASPLEVRLEYGSGSTSDNTRIYYTLDGSEPTPYSFEFIPGSDYIFQRFSNTIKARAFRQGYTPSEIVSATYDLTQNTTTLPTPTVYPNSGTFAGNVTVYMGSSVLGAEIRYTTDGSTPNENSALFSSPLEITNSTFVRARIYLDGYNPSEITQATYVITNDVSTPEFYPANGGVFVNPTNVTMSTTTPGASIYYTLDGSIPDASSTLYQSGVYLESRTLVKAIAIKGGTSSQIQSAWFNFTGAAPPPSITPNGGEFTNSVSVEMTTTLSNAIIRYTTNGAEPTTYSNTFSAPFNLGVGTHTVKAKTFHSSYQVSETVTANFTVFAGGGSQVATPDVYPRNTQTFVEPILLNISCDTEGALIRYTVGFNQLPADPTQTGAGSITYNGPVQLGVAGSNMFIKVRAFKNGLTASNIVQTGQLSVVDPLGAVNKPTITPAPGIYNNSVSVTLATTSQFAQVLYTKDGTEPISLLPILPPTQTYNNPINIFGSTTIIAKGRRTFFSDSDTATAVYILQCGDVEITPTEGQFSDSATVTMTSITNNAQIRYNLDGTAPTESSQLYTGPFSVYVGNHAIRAKAFRNNYESSNITSAEIVVTPQAVAPVITSDISNKTVNIGDKVVFRVQATGNPDPTYKWFRNNVQLPGEAKDSLVLKNVQLGDAGVFQVEVSNAGGSVLGNTAQLIVNDITSVRNKLSGMPQDFVLYENYPNPFNPSTKIKFGIPEQSKVRVVIYDVLGKMVTELENDVMNAGFYELNWNAGLLSSGIYFLKLKAESNSGRNSFTDIKKMVLLK